MVPQEETADEKEERRIRLLMELNSKEEAIHTIDKQVLELTLQIHKEEVHKKKLLEYNESLKSNETFTEKDKAKCMEQNRRMSYGVHLTIRKLYCLIEVKKADKAWWEWSLGQTKQEYIDLVSA